MCLFRKPKLNDRVSIDVIIPGGELPVEWRNVSRDFLNKFLTRKQIKYLNSLVPPEIEIFTPQDIRELNEKMIKNKIHELAEEKRKEEFTEADHIQNKDDYKAYVENNKDKMMMTDEEFGKFQEMLGGINKHREEVLERIEELEKDGKAAPGDVRRAREFNDFFLKSATGQNK